MNLSKIKHILRFGKERKTNNSFSPNISRIYEKHPKSHARIKDILGDSNFLNGKMSLAKELVGIFEDCEEYELAEETLNFTFKVSKSKNAVGAVIVSKLNKQWRFQEAINFSERMLDQGIWDQRVLLSYVRAMSFGLGDKIAKEKLEYFCHKNKIEKKGLVSYIETLENLGEFSESEILAEKILNDGESVAFVKKDLEKRLQLYRHQKVTDKILNSFKVKCKEIAGLVVLIDHSSPLAQIWQTPLAIEMKKRGFEVIALEQRGATFELRTENPKIVDLHGILDSGRVRLGGEVGELSLKNDWKIDLEKRSVVVENIDLSVAVGARIGTKVKRYNFSWESKIAKALLSESLYRGDAALSVCKKIYDCEEFENLPIYFFGGMSHYSPSNVYKQFCEKQASGRKMEYIGFVAGYEHYYTNLKNKFSTALSVHNLTKHPELNSPARVTKSSFDLWKAHVENKSELVESVKEIVKMDRANKVQIPAVEQAESRILNWKKSKGKVVCLFGKIMYDIWMEDMSGPAHSDIVDWLNHSIESVIGTDTLLLIKPHPNEIKNHIVRPKEFFSDMINVPLNENVMLLDHKWFNINEISRFINFGILWSGTAALELTSEKIPILMCSNWGRRDHPINFQEIESREHYSKILSGEGIMSVSDDLASDAALLIKYYSSEEVLVPHEFGVMPYLMSTKERPSWKHDKVEDFSKNGDRFVRAVAEKIL